jgi:uncharacterized protein
MPNSFLIDGYNLIHALGMIQKQVPQGGLETSRLRLLDYLAESFGDDARNVTVVFDATNAPRGAVRDQEHRGIGVRFAAKNQSADDLIEDLLAAPPAPRSLVVVSNDARLQNAARRVGAQAWSHDTLLDFFEQGQKGQPATKTAANDKDTVSPDESKRWQREFADVENDPDLKEFFEHNQFE